MNNHNYVYLYGIGSAADQYRIVRYEYITAENVSIKNIKMGASWIKLNNGSVEHVYAIDNRPGLGRLVANTIKRNSIEGNVIFKDLLEREGMLII